MSDDEFEGIFGMVDFNGGGTIEFDEFLDFGFDAYIPKDGKINSGVLKNIRKALTQSDFDALREQRKEAEGGDDDDFFG